MTPLEKYYFKTREPKKEPVQIPEKKDIVVLNQRKRIRKIFEQQAIMYGVDILDSNIEEIMMAKKSREREKKRERDKERQREIIERIFDNSA